MTLRHAHTHTSLIRLTLAALALASLAACGYREGLERPPPMWGEARDQYERDEAARQQAEEAAETAEQPAPAPQN
jgi:predicted small lipoprotein YifL